MGHFTFKLHVTSGWMGKKIRRERKGRKEERKKGGKEEEGREERMDNEREGGMEGENDFPFRKPAIFTFIKDLFSRNA